MVHGPDHQGRKDTQREEKWCYTALMAQRRPRPKIEYQDRDYELLRSLFESRVMTLSQAAALYFDGSYEAAKKRLQKLESARAVYRRRRNVNEPAVYALTEQSLELLRTKGFLDQYRAAFNGLPNMRQRATVSDMTMRHELAVMDVKAALMPAIERTDRFSTVEFGTWPFLYQFKAKRTFTNADGSLLSEIVLQKPDGFIRVYEQEEDGGLSEHRFFLEVDRSSEPQHRLAAKASAYRDYYSSGNFATRYGHPGAPREDFPFRVLMILRNTERRNNAAESLLRLKPPILTQVRLTTYQELHQDPLGPIWLVPRDYRTALTNTPFDLAIRPESRVYARQPEREAIVEARLQKHQLFDS